MPREDAPTGRPVRLLILYSTNWGHYQYPFASNGRRTCQASACLINHEYLDAVGMCVWVGERASGAFVRPMGANTTQYHPIPPQYHPPMNANTTPKDDHPMPTDQCQCRTPDGGRCLLRTHITYTQRSASDRALVILFRGFCLPGTARSLELNTPEGVSGSRRPTALQPPPSNMVNCRL